MCIGNLFAHPLRALRMDSQDPTTEPFLLSEELPTKESVNRQRQRRRPISSIYLIFLSFTIGVVSALIGLAAFRTTGSCSVSQFEGATYSPADHIIEPQNVVFTLGIGDRQTIYQGPSTPEGDRAWADLYGFGLSRIPRSSAAKLVNKTVPLPGEPGSYVVMLNVFHQLHCVNMLRKRLWSDSEGIDPTDEELGEVHLSHCLDALRQSLMCSADVTPIPFRWDATAQEAKAVVEIQHTCRNFEKVHHWAKEHAVEKFDTKVHVPDDL